MTDGEVVNLVRRLCIHLDKAVELICEIREGDHPSANQIADMLHEEAGTAGLSPGCVLEYLNHPEKWEKKID